MLCMVSNIQEVVGGFTDKTTIYENTDSRGLLTKLDFIQVTNNGDTSAQVTMSIEENGITVAPLMTATTITAGNTVVDNLPHRIAPGQKIVATSTTDKVYIELAGLADLY